MVMDYLSSNIDKNTGLSTDTALGDWLGPQYAQLGTAFIVTAYHIYDLEIMAKLAAILGRGDDAAKYAKVREERKAFFNDKFVTADHKTMALVTIAPGTRPVWRVADTQTSYALGLALNAFSDKNVPYAEKFLADTVRRKNVDDSVVERGPYSLMTGFIGTSWISQALTEHG